MRARNIRSADERTGRAAERMGTGTRRTTILWYGTRVLYGLSNHRRPSRHTGLAPHRLPLPPPPPPLRVGRTHRMSFRCGIPIIRQECAAVAAEGHLCRARLVCVRCAPCLCRLRGRCCCYYIIVPAGGNVYVDFGDDDDDHIFVRVTRRLAGRPPPSPLPPDTCKIILPNP
ncbi:Uncharacterized protein FWK35_00007129 [Aphis craccivora]|uniref:Uncharacterized protein n=1 Tax=Aphis craccivora TaxID=307492 RepID=A0A6G0ZLA0_APHCR|nr:Uncharacterized protein FWK35_00007129 [Aphis craccivora]